MRKLIAANWKMCLTRAEALALAESLEASLDKDILICPPFVHLEAVGGILRSKGIMLGGQNCAHQAMGALTGEIAAAHLADYGCSHVILGHSERRQYFAESGPFLVQKLEQAFTVGLIPIICVGETQTQYEQGRTAVVLAQQLTEIAGALKGRSFVIAYEPVWAIGSGRVPQMFEIEAAHACIRTELMKHGIENGYRVIYGGSVKPENAAQIYSVAGVDGALIGSASLKADGFKMCC
jgi:triosephosphate isomerase (TIM)